MAAPKFDPPHFRPKKGAQCWDLGDIPCFGADFGHADVFRWIASDPSPERAFLEPQSGGSNFGPWTDPQHRYPIDLRNDYGGRLWPAQSSIRWSFPPKDRIWTMCCFLGSVVITAGGVGPPGLISLPLPHQGSIQQQLAPRRVPESQRLFACLWVSQFACGGGCAEEVVRVGRRREAPRPRTCRCASASGRGARRRCACCWSGGRAPPSTCSGSWRLGLGRARGEGRRSVGIRCGPPT